MVIDIDHYLLEHCKRHVEEGYANRIEEAIVNGTPLEDVLDEIMDKIEKCVAYTDAITDVLVILDKYKAGK